MTTPVHRPPRGVLSACLMPAFLAVQIAVPLVRLWAPRPVRFGWQMFAGIRSAPRFATITTDSLVAELTRADILGHPRADMDLADDRIHAHLCAVTPGISAVRFEFQGEVRDVPC
jgi:hypothetical protein